MVTTLDHQTNGRALLGLGAAWDQRELDDHGIAAGSTLRERLAMLDEALAIVQALLSGETVDRDGPTYELRSVRHAPRPLQARVPVLVGAQGERVGLRIVARHADLWQSWAPIDSVERFQAKSVVLDEHCAALGRDPAAIVRIPGAKVVLRDDPAEAERVFEGWVREHRWPGSVLEEVRESTWCTTPALAVEALSRYRRAGAGGFISQAVGPYDDETVERLAREVRPALA
jgi:alkanesulfonate monooxygenase SsuD/methylene tetrahydromethanopterin reductase-like flavin-dependent oxidoreductase (luciferase family)